MILELIGPPGSGKTTTAQAMAETNNGHVVYLLGNSDVDGVELSRWRRRLHWVVATVRKPKLIVVLLIRLPVDRTVWRKAFEVCRTDAIVRKLRQRGGEWVVDEGPRHRLFALASEVNSERSVRDALGLLYRVDSVAVLSIDPSEVAERLRRRGSPGGFASAPTDEVVTLVRRYLNFAARLPGQT